MNYQLGSRISYYTAGGELREVVVTEIDERIKNGEPGFSGTMDNGDSVWGYDDDIEEVISY